MKQPPIKTKELSGSTVQIADGQNWEIASITAYGETPQGGTTEAPVALTGISSVTVNDDVTELPIPRPLRRVGDVKDKCVTRQGHEGVEKLVVTYNVGFVELDGTEVWARYARISTVGGNFYEMPIPKKPKASNVQVTGTLSSHLTCDNAYTKKGDCVWAFVNTQGAVSTLRIGFSDDSIDTAEKVNAYLAAQKEAGTPVQVAYQLAAPETYATDPLDIDNAAGPLTVMTGGELEVTLTHRMLTPYTAWTIQYDSEGEYTGDFFNVEDYDRIKQNIEYLREYAYFLYGGFTLRGMVAVTVESYGYASTIDALDANLESIAANTFRPPDMMPVKQWRGNQPPPGADDWNRIENTCLLLFEQFERQSACLPKLAFELKGSAF